MIDDDELKANIVNTKPYKQWIENLRIKLDSVGSDVPVAPLPAELPLLDRQQAFGYTQEDIKFLMAPMAKNGEEGIGSMGNDSPLAVLSGKNKPLYNYFKQLFAQVTNPPIDPIREAIVMSLVSFIGPKPNLLDINQVNPPMRLEVSQPVLDFAGMAKLRDIEQHTQGQVQERGDRHHLPAGLGPRRRGGQAGLAVRAGRGRDQGRCEHPHHQRPCRERDAGGHSRAAGAVGHPPAPRARGPAHHGGPGGGDRHGA